MIGIGGGDGTQRRWLIAAVALLLAVAFVATTLISFSVSKTALRESIVDSELPLTSDTISSEIKRDMTRPIVIASVMANDTFLRDWVASGEMDVGKVSGYLHQIADKFHVISAFLVSEKTHNYYYPNGVLKKVDEKEWRDVWYYRVRSMPADYEINVDFDMANHDALTIFVNYKLYGADHAFLGATGVGLTVNSVDDLITQYQHRYQRRIYFTDGRGQVVVAGNGSPAAKANIHQVEGLSAIAASALTHAGGAFEYERNGDTHLVQVRYIPELDWYLFVERIQDEALRGARRALYGNLAIALVATAIVVLLLSLTISWFQGRIERMAAIDKLTGLRNRQAHDILMQQAVREARRSGRPLSVIMLDIDHFKLVNDRHGHLSGDQVLHAVAATTQSSLRRADVVCRWGGEEFLAMLPDCDRDNAVQLAEKIRANVEGLETRVDDAAIKVTVSLGIAQLGPEDSQESLLARADHALYAAKRAGRNRATAG